MKLLKFETSTCVPCKIVSNILKSLEIPHEIYNIELEENVDLVNKYSVMSVPTLILLDDNGDVVDQIIGNQTQQIEDLKQHFS